jgi:pyrimidine-nucleoside phosphorylase
MIVLAGIKPDLETAIKMANSSISDGSALAKFKQLIDTQGGDSSIINDYSKLPQAQEKLIVRSPQNGFIKSFQNNLIGLSLIELGGGRKLQSDQIDFGVGFKFNKKIGDQVEAGEELLTIYHHPEQNNIAQKLAEDFISKLIQIVPNKVSPNKCIIDTVYMN